MNELHESDKFKVKKAADKKTIKTLSDCLKSSLKAYVVVPGLLTVTATVNAPKLG